MAGEYKRYLSVGPLLREYRQQRNLSQAELAGLLGVSQPYVSRLEHGRRSAISYALWEKLVLVLDRPELYVIDSQVDDVAEVYDRALISYGAGDHTAAEVLFDSVAGAESSDSYAAADLIARSKFWLAGIRRDRNDLEGAHGAESLYQSVLEFHKASGRDRRVHEVQFMLGACREMRKDHVSALAIYESIEASVTKESRRMMARINSRLGALTTKMTDYQRASHHLAVSTAIAPHLEDAGPYSYGFEKLAILETRLGRLDRATAALYSARSELGPADHLRWVQSYCVESNVEAKRGDIESALAILKKAEEIASKHDYEHQRAYMEDLRQTWTRNG